MPGRTPVGAPKHWNPLHHLCTSFLTVAAPGSIGDEDSELCSASQEGIPKSSHCYSAEKAQWHWAASEAGGFHLLRSCSQEAEARIYSVRRTLSVTLPGAALAAP